MITVLASAAVIIVASHWKDSQQDVVIHVHQHLSTHFVADHEAFLLHCLCIKISANSAGKVGDMSYVLLCACKYTVKLAIPCNTSLLIF